MKSNNKSRWIIGVLVLIGVAGAVIGGITLGGDKTVIDDAGLYTVQKGQLVIGIDETGTIKAQDQEVIKCKVEGKTTILTLVPEGTHVKKGDLLIELDASSLVDQQVTQRIAVQTAEAAFINAREALAIGESQAQSDLELAELTLNFAKQDLKKYTEGDYPNEVNNAESKIAVAREAVQQAEQKYQWSQKLAKDKYLSDMELKADELSWRRSELDLKLAQNQLKLLQEYTYLRQLAKYESDVKQAELALERTKRKTSATLAQLKAELAAADSKLEQQKRLLTKIDSNVAEAKILAPSDGIVVYATSARTGGMRGSEEPMREGRTVFEREELIYLPTSNRVKAELKLHESVLDKVRLDMPATVTVDALPGRIFAGKVRKIGLLPDAQMMWMNPDLKVYATEVFLDGDGSDLRTGMSCRASIVLEEYEDVLYVPVQSVVRIGNQPTVYVMEGGQSKPRPVEIGLDNNRMVHIKSGLEVGEKVLLAPPLAAAEAEQGRRKTNGESRALENGQPNSGMGDQPTTFSAPGTGMGGGQGSGQMGGETGTPGNRRGSQGDSQGMPRNFPGRSTEGSGGQFPREGMQRPNGGGFPGQDDSAAGGQGMPRSGQRRPGTMGGSRQGFQRPEGAGSEGFPGGRSGNRMPPEGQQSDDAGSTPQNRPEGGLK
ncbi:MAG: efflux transporter periplasmic adaptor subunit [Phycisphaerae bacterium]|nr:efflux transporter periplasmic adaptor subunit [Phycisphaerae bacterium]